VLKSIDVLIGLIVVLLALSMAVTVVTQAITTIINSRGRHLRRGLTDLLQQLDPALTPVLSKAIATRVLTHPLVSGSNTPVAGGGTASGAWAALVTNVRRLAGGPRLGNVVHREEFTKLLMLLGSGDAKAGLEAGAENALKSALASNGVSDPDAVLKNVRIAALQLERANPELSNAMRQNIALLHQAESDFVAKVNSWFDQTMDRTSQRFTASTRAITFAAAFLVAFGLQVDTPQLVNRLAADESMRQAFVREAQALSAQRQDIPAQDQEGVAIQYQSFLATNGVIRLPSSEGWWRSYEQANVFGLLITALLLSLGAPFWYSALGKLLQLRSVLAVKDDAQRTARQTNEPPPAVVSPANPVS
jgi:hypothetical protein